MTEVQNKTKKDIIMHRIQEHYDAVVNAGYEVVGVFLQGSQNYELDYSGSDIDTKAIVLPSFSDFCLNKKPVSYTHIMENNEHVDIKDIRLMFENIKKQNINFVEILFTHYFILNPKYPEVTWSQIFCEEVGRYNEIVALNSMCGMQLEKKKALEHPYPTTAWKIEKYGYDPKQLHHIIRMNDFLKKYILGKPYTECLKASDPEYLISVKRDGIHTLQEARDISKNMCESTKIIKDNYLQNYVINEKQKAFVDYMFNDIVVKTMKCYYSEELLNEHNHTA